MQKMAKIGQECWDACLWAGLQRLKRGAIQARAHVDTAEDGLAQRHQYTTTKYFHI